MGFTWELFCEQTKPRPVEYTRSIVSYLDILGFRQLVETRTAGAISRILRILTESVKPNVISKSEGLRFTTFSDTVIRSVPVARHFPHNFIFELRSILYAQMALIPQNILYSRCRHDWRQRSELGACLRARYRAGV